MSLGNIVGVVLKGKQKRQPLPSCALILFFLFLGGEKRFLSNLRQVPILDCQEARTPHVIEDCLYKCRAPARIVSGSEEFHEQRIFNIKGSVRSVSDSASNIRNPESWRKSRTSWSQTWPISFKGCGGSSSRRLIAMHTHTHKPLVSRHQNASLRLPHIQRAPAGHQAIERD